MAQLTKIVATSGQLTINGRDPELRDFLLRMEADDEEGQTVAEMLDFKPLDVDNDGNS